MLLAAIIAQIGYSKAKRAASDRSRFLTSAIAYTIFGSSHRAFNPVAALVPEVRAPSAAGSGKLISAGP